MRTISPAAVTDAVAKLCIQANTHLPPDIVSALDRTRREEPWPLAKETLGLLWDNLELAEREELPVCQDTGMACVFVELARRSTSRATLSRPSTRGSAGATARAICASPSWVIPCAG